MMFTSSIYRQWYVGALWTCLYTTMIVVVWPHAQSTGQEPGNEARALGKSLGMRPVAVAIHVHVCFSD